MRSTLATAVTLSTLLIAVHASAATDHLVAPEAVSQRLQAAAAAREADIAAVRVVLSRPEAAQVARTVGADLEHVKAAAAALGDDELRDLAQRARAVQVDPVAGLSNDVETLLIIFLIVAIVILVLQAV